MYILGVSAFYMTVRPIKNGQIVAAAQEERFTRKKHDASFPHHSIKYCLDHAKIDPNDIDNVVFYEKPFLKFEHLSCIASRGFLVLQRQCPG